MSKWINAEDKLPEWDGEHEGQEPVYKFFPVIVESGERLMCGYDVEHDEWFDSQYQHSGWKVLLWFDLPDPEKGDVR